LEAEQFELFKKRLEAEHRLPDDTKKVFQLFKEEKKGEVVHVHDERLYRKHGMGLDSGQYELIALISHKGRSADSGHYVSWVHKSGGSLLFPFATADMWTEFDDDNVKEVKIDDVLRLNGGGDWHMSYYLIYRKLESI